MPKTILTVGFELASDDVSNEEFTSKASLLDWDIVLFKPDIQEFLHSSSRYQGKPSLSDTESFRLKEACEHWRREIKQAYESGKTVIVFLPEVQEVYIDTGERQYSGTGRSRVTTTIVALYSNYKSIPAVLNPTNARGSGVKPAGRGSEVLAAYWSAFGEASRYMVQLGGADVPACLLTKNGDRPVGALYKSKASSGSLLCLPDIDFYPSGFFTEDAEWTSEAETFASRLIASIVAIDSALRADSAITPEPQWASDDRYCFEAERELRVQLLDAEAKVEEAQKHKENVLDQLRAAGRLRALLYEKGRPLELSIVEALRHFGFVATQYRDSESEFDVVFQSEEGRLIGEAEGRDTKPISVEKLRQLAMNIHEDLLREDVSEPAKAVLFGNGFRLEQPDSRGCAFTDKCISAAKSSSTALVATKDLFSAAAYLAESSDSEYARQCRLALLNDAGLVEFPAPPEKKNGAT